MTATTFTAGYLPYNNCRRVIDAGYWPYNNLCKGIDAGYLPYNNRRRGIDAGYWPQFNLYRQRALFGTSPCFSDIFRAVNLSAAAGPVSGTPKRGGSKQYLYE